MKAYIGGRRRKCQSRNLCKVTLVQSGADESYYAISAAAAIIK